MLRSSPVPCPTGLNSGRPATLSPEGVGAMSHMNRTTAARDQGRTRKCLPLLEILEERLALAPYVVTAPLQATFTPLPVNPAAPNTDLGTVAIAPLAVVNYPSAAD